MPSSQHSYSNNHNGLQLSCTQHAGASAGSLLGAAVQLTPPHVARGASADTVAAHAPLQAAGTTQTTPQAAGTFDSSTQLLRWQEQGSSCCRAELTSVTSTTVTHQPQCWHPSPARCAHPALEPLGLECGAHSSACSSRRGQTNSSRWVVQTWPFLIRGEGAAAAFVARHTLASYPVRWDRHSALSHTPGSR